MFTFFYIFTCTILILITKEIIFNINWFAFQPFDIEIGEIIVLKYFITMTFYKLHFIGMLITIQIILKELIEIVDILLVIPADLYPAVIRFDVFQLNLTYFFLFG